MYRILIVEDDVDISELLQSWLTEAGYQTAEAEDGLKALEVFESGQFDLVLLDLMLPRLDGFGVCEWIRKEIEYPDRDADRAGRRGGAASRLRSAD